MSSDSKVWLSPAKINLFLHITGRRADGMHELQTAFQFIDLYDEMRFEMRDDGKVERGTDIAGVPANEDLCVKAALALQSAGKVATGVNIQLHKNIPMGGGLGGASSNAATTLRVLNQYWQTGLSVDELAELGRQLGADVPVFVRGQAAWAEGVGEKLTPFVFTEKTYLLINPGVHVNTAKMFADSQLTRNCPAITICDPEQRGLGNVFEPVARARYPMIDELFVWLEKFTQPFLTGTGACIVAPVEDADTARSWLKSMPAGAKGFVVQSQNTSSMITQLLN